MNSNFSNFWNNKVNFINSIPIEYQIHKTHFSTFSNISYYDLYFKSFDGANIYAKYIKNEAIRKTNIKVPVLFYFHGYPASSRNWLEKSAYCSLGYDIIALDFRGQGGLSNNISRSSSTAFGHISYGLNENIDDMIFVKNIMDILLLFKIVSLFPDVDKNNFNTYGASQGGAFSLISAALHPNIKKCIALYPFLSNLTNIFYKDNSKNAYSEFNLYSRWFNVRGSKDKEIFEKLSYIDTLYFAPKIKAKVLFGVSELDTDCPPKTQYAVFNNIQSEKILCTYKKYKHEDIPHFNNEVLKFLIGD